MTHSVTAVAIGALIVSGFAQTARAQPVAADTNVIAIVLGKRIIASESKQLSGLIVGPLLEQFARENGIEPTPEELDALVRKTDAISTQQQARRKEERDALVKELKGSSLSASEREKKEARLKKIERVVKYQDDMERQSMVNEEQVRATKREAARTVVRTWKINRALYRTYGGRVAFQQAGPEPLGAYRDFLREQERKGRFRIVDKTLGTSFWGYFTNDSIHTFYSKQEGAKFINTPWWMMDQLPKK